MLLVGMAANFVGGIVWARVADASGRYRGVMTSTAAVAVALTLALALPSVREARGALRVVLPASLYVVGCVARRQSEQRRLQRPRDRAAGAAWRLARRRVETVRRWCGHSVGRLGVKPLADLGRAAHDVVVVRLSSRGSSSGAPFSELRAGMFRRDRVPHVRGGSSSSSHEPARSRPLAAPFLAPTPHAACLVPASSRA